MHVSHEIDGISSTVTFPITEWDMSVRPVRIELLGKDQEPLDYVATGFLFFENGIDYLYTSWHVITGYNFLNLEVMRPPERRFARVVWKRINDRGNGTASIGDSESRIIPLYDDAGMPVWYQQEQRQPNADLEALNIFVPEHVDLVAIPFEVPSKERRFRSYLPADTSSAALQNGSLVYITGYPWGYSALGDITPEPLFIGRNIASWVSTNPHNFLLDGVGARGMSGSPVLTKTDAGFKIVGVYSGAYFPDVIATGRVKDSFSSLGIAVRFGARLFIKF